MSFDEKTGEMIDGATLMARERLERDFAAENGDSQIVTDTDQLNLELEAQKADVRRQRIDLDKRKSGKYARVRVESTTGNLLSRFGISLLRSGPNQRQEDRNDASILKSKEIKQNNKPKGFVSGKVVTKEEVDFVTVRKFPLNIPERREPRDLQDLMTAHKKGEMVKGASPYDFLPYSAWGEDMNAVSFVQSSPAVMPRDAPLPDSFDLDNWSKMKADPMHA